jgi:hypothetical protein
VQMDEVREDFGSASLMFFGKADSLHINNSWRGKTSREVRGEKAELEVLGAKTEASKLSELQGIKEDMNTAILKAEGDNEEIVKEHKVWANSFAWFAVLFVFILDGLLVWLSYWMTNHEARKIKENKVKKELKEQSIKTPKVPVNEGVKTKETITLKDGEIKEFEDSRGSIIGVPLSTGDIKGYTLGKLRNLIKNSGEARGKELNEYLIKLENL